MLMDQVAGLYHYHRIGHDERPLELLANGLIGEGGSSVEQRWELRNGGNVARLMILGEYGEICRVELLPDGCWRGAWTQFEQMPVELMPQRLQPLRSLEDRGGIEYVPHRFHYISYQQLVQDCHTFARSLPPVKAIAGVPRSGMIPASLIALELNVPMIAVETLLAEANPVIPLPRRGFKNRVDEGMILVVDDTCASGRQADKLRELIQAPVKLAAIYVEDRPRICVDYYHGKLPPFSQFYEWTMLHDDNNRLMLVDMDGVLCEDWSGGNEDVHADRYAEFLANVKPRRIPTQPLRGIVTNRLELHRPETEAWLAKHGIEYGSLTMSPYATFAERDQAHDAAARKAQAYLTDPSLRLFIESDDDQARQIARRTGRPVFSIARNGLV
jgi:orotate phosphoribosyltransferase